MTDLDARVAALMDDADTYAATQRMEDRYELEQAIRAKLQKPALHELVTDAEVTHAIGVYLQNRRVPYIRGVSPYTADIRAVLESFLQGRAKPAQEEIPPLTNSPWFGCGECDVSFKCHGGKSGCIRASKGEK